MPSFLAALEGGKPPLWLDADAYAGRLLAPGGVVPWLDASAFVAWRRKTQGMLKSDVVSLAAEPVVTASLAANPELRTAMAAKPRLLFALKTLLADQGLRTQLTELSCGLRSVFPAAPLALRLPSPRRWISLAYAQAGQGEPDEITVDDVDSAAMYVADFLRSFGECGLDVLLCEEDLGSEPATSNDLEVYQPALNVARHYRWACGLKLAETSAYRGAVPGFDFAIAPAAVDCAHCGVIVDAPFWGGAPLPKLGKGHFRFAYIPESSKPESVLERVQALR